MVHTEEIQQISIEGVHQKLSTILEYCTLEINQQICMECVHQKSLSRGLNTIIQISLLTAYILDLSVSGRLVLSELKKTLFFPQRDGCLTN